MDFNDEIEDFSGKLDKDDPIVYVTIKKIRNGFTITFPEDMRGESDEVFVKTLNGLMKYLSAMWNEKVINITEKKITKETVEKIITPIRDKK